MSDNERTLRDDFTPRRIAAFAVTLVVALVLLPFVQADDAATDEVTGQVVARKIADDMRGAAGDSKRIKLDVEGPTALIPTFERAAGQGEFDVVEDGETLVRGTIEAAGSAVVAKWEVVPPGGEPKSIEQSQRKGTWHAVLPPLLAILIALFFRRLVLGLGAAVWLGASIVHGNPLTGLWAGAKDYVWGSVADSFSLYILGFTLMLVGMVQVVNRMGGIAGVLDLFGRFTKSARSARITTALMGLAIFFDDYANTIVVGTSMRPVTDERGVSREKLAYLVDSMSAPIAGIAIISTWVGYEVGLFGELAQQLALDRSGYDIFFSIIPLRFYCLFTIVFVLASAIMSRDFGPMLTAERRAAAGEVLRPGSNPLTSEIFNASAPADDIPKRWFNAIGPIGLVLVLTFVGMYWSGWSAGEASIPPLFEPGVLAGWSQAAGGLTSWEVWRDAFSNADGAKVLFFAALSGSVLALGLAIGQRLLAPAEAAKAFFGAIPAMKLAIAILILAWSIRAVCDDLGTSIYLLAAVQDVLSPVLLPVITFLLAAVVAFATGTSWGTMGILLPAVVPLAFYMTEGAANAEIILLLCCGAVLDGAIFGDHCSPISDTTVMSSLSASCDHVDHVRTQMPYAVTTMSVAALFGYVGVAIGLPVLAALVAGPLVLIAIIRLAGHPTPG